MQVLNYPNWFIGAPGSGGTSPPTTTTDPATTCSKKYVGIAIGPDSEVGAVRVNGKFTLQAGRPLTLDDNAYQLEGLHPKIVSSAQGLASTGVGLQVLLFENYDEIHTGLERANASYSSAYITPPGAQPAQPQFSFPFSGRDTAQFLINADGGAGTSVQFVVQGVRWSSQHINSSGAITGAIQKVVLASGTTVPDVNNEYAFYIEDENWDALEVFLFNMVGNANGITIDAVAFGEIRL